MRKKISAALTAATMLLALSAAGVAAHSQTVTPNGNGEGFTKPIANPWAMAHCVSAAPFTAAESSGGVVQFNPPINFSNCEAGSRGGQ